MHRDPERQHPSITASEGFLLAWLCSIKYIHDGLDVAMWLVFKLSQSQGRESVGFCLPRSEESGCPVHCIPGEVPALAPGSPRFRSLSHCLQGLPAVPHCGESVH